MLHSGVQVFSGLPCYRCLPDFITIGVCHFPLWLPMRTSTWWGLQAVVCPPVIANHQVQIEAADEYTTFQFCTREKQSLSDFKHLLELANRDRDGTRILKKVNFKANFKAVLKKISIWTCSREAEQISISHVNFFGQVRGTLTWGGLFCAQYYTTGKIIDHIMLSSPISFHPPYQNSYFEDNIVFCKKQCEDFSLWFFYFHWF